MSADKAEDKDEKAGSADLKPAAPKPKKAAGGKRHRRKNAKSEATVPTGKPGGSLPARQFPKESLGRAVTVAETLRAKNAGNPWPPADVAAAMNVSGTANTFFYIAAASRDYGLTNGGRDSHEISLTDLGRSVVYPESASEVSDAKLSAFRKVKVFSDVLDYYRGNNLPELQYVKNTLKRNFHIDDAHHDDFVRVFTENCDYVGLKAGQAVTDLPTGERRATPHDSGQTVTIAADPGTGLKCFVAIPFTEKESARPAKFFAEVLSRLITAACQAAGFEVITADRRGSDVIHATIVNSLLDADLVVADLTDHNPNVLFELGMRMHLDKPIALIQAEGTPRIFDVDNVIRAYSYNPNLWPSTLETDLPNLTAHIKGAWDGRGKEETYMKLLRRESKQS